MNEQNLKPNTERTPKQRSELARKAGKASGESRRRAKTFREAAQAALQVEQDFKMPNGETLRGTARDGVVLGMLQAAQRGNPKAAKWLADILGESSININLSTDPDSRPEINIE